MKDKQGGSIPDDIATAIAKNPKALLGFEHMPPSHQQEFLRYILEAKEAKTRTHRIALSVTAIERWYADRKKKTATRRTKK